MVFARWHQRTSHVIRAFLGPHKSSTQTASRMVQPISHFCTAQAEHPYTLQWAALPSQNCPFHWGHLDHLVHWTTHHSIGILHNGPPLPPRNRVLDGSTDPWAHPSQQPLLQGSRSWLTDRRLTDKPRYFVCSKPHLASAATQPNNKMEKLSYPWRSYHIATKATRKNGIDIPQRDTSVRSDSTACIRSRAVYWRG